MCPLRPGPCGYGQHRPSPQMGPSLRAFCPLLDCPALLGGAWLWCLWPAFSFLLVGLCYAVFGARAMQKQETGRLTPAACVLLLPCLVAVRANMACWLRGRTRRTAVLNERIHIGSILAARPYRAVLDVCAESPLHRPPARYAFVPLLDMVPPSSADLLRAADALQAMLLSGDTPVLVCWPGCCAMVGLCGSGRSGPAPAQGLPADGCISGNPRPAAAACGPRALTQPVPKGGTTTGIVARAVSYLFVSRLFFLQAQEACLAACAENNQRKTSLLTMTQTIKKGRDRPLPGFFSFSGGHGCGA